MPHDARMSLLAEPQRAFVRALMASDARIPHALTGPTGAASPRRFGIHRNNILSGLTRCLSARFPVVERLVGQEFFRATACVFIEAHPPHSPALLEYGGEFAEFLTTFAPAQSLPYLADVARLEWLIATAYHAADARPAAAAALGALGDAAPEAQLVLQPSCALLVSRYPVFSIWQTNTHEESVRPIDLSAGGEAVLVVRPRFEVAVIRIDMPTYAFIAALAAGHALELAAELAAELDAKFDLGAALQLLFASGAVANVKAPGNALQEEMQEKPQQMRMLPCAI